MKLEKVGVSTKVINALKKKHVYTVSDLLEWAPKRYYFFGHPKAINECEVDTYVAVSAKQLYVKKNRMKTKKKNYLFFKFEDTNGVQFSVSLFDRVFDFSKFEANSGKQVVVCGRFKVTDFGPVFDVLVDIYPISDYKPHVHPVYSNVRNVSDDNLRHIRQGFFEMQPEIVEKKVRQLSSVDLMSYPLALYRLHYPENLEQIKKAKERILFNDLLYFNLALKSNIVEAPSETDKVFNSWQKTQEFVSSLPYALTEGEGSQKSTLNDIFIKAKNGNRVNMLVQGDVGCGKTIVAASLMMYSAENDYQSILMAPRDVLAKQHYQEIKSYADKMGFSCVFLGGNLKAKERKEVLSKIKSGEADFIVGTHACIADSVKYHNLGAVITDEEHLFGVDQKNALVKKANDGVHSLSMSATPIPRTMATVMYGQQKEIKIISKKPAGRLPILTTGEQKRENVFYRMENEINNGHQCYVVCPAIEDNDKSDLVSLESIEHVYRSYFEPKGIKIGIVNGKMDKEDVEKTIADFVSNDIQILLSTTVIEVGVNVPNSTVMVIEQADRFGLATLHQLRGRVGRNSLQSYCLLICEDPENQRIKVMCETNDGFKIAEADLSQRGSGDLLGTAQSGINDYVEKMLNNPQMFAKAEIAANYCLEHGYGRFLMAQYEEHLKLDSEEKAKSNKK